MSKINRMFKAAAFGMILIAGGAMIFTGCSNKGEKAAIEKYGSAKLKVYLPGAYTSDTLFPDFEKKYNVKVIPEYFDSNEMMYAKVQAGDKYDVLIPSDYMIERLMQQKSLQPLDKTAIPNLSELAPAVTKLSYDPDNTYTVPYFWGNVGIVYNKTKVSPEVIEKEGWNIFHNADYAGKLYWYDSERDSFMVALKALGFSMNTENKDEINKAYEWLLKMHQTVKPTYVTDEVIDSMSNGIKDIAIVYSGDAAYILDKNKDMAYHAPSQGTNFWSDAMVIPANAETPKLANEFINYVISYEAAKGNTEAVGYTSANKKVLDEMTGANGAYANNAAYLPRTGYEKDEIFHDNEVIRAMISELWIKVKAN